MRSILLRDKLEKPTDNTNAKISDFGLSKLIKRIDNDRDKMTGQLGTCVIILFVIILI